VTGRPPACPRGAIGSAVMDTFTPAEVAAQLGVSTNKVRQLIAERKLMAVPGSGNSKIPVDFIQDGVVLKHLPGLLTVLYDGRFTDEEAFAWLFEVDDSLPGTPVQALRDDRHTEVTRRAQALAL
jgi:excisionase family DNA binding protein